MISQIKNINGNTASKATTETGSTQQANKAQGTNNQVSQSKELAQNSRVNHDFSMMNYDMEKGVEFLM